MSSRNSLRKGGSARGEKEGIKERKKGSAIAFSHSPNPNPPEKREKKIQKKGKKEGGGVFDDYALSFRPCATGKKGGRRNTGEEGGGGEQPPLIYYNLPTSRDLG